MEKGQVLMKSKKASEMAFSTIIFIILGLILLVMVIVVLNKSSGGFMGAINTFLSSSNVDTVKNSCNILVTQGSEYEYCCVNKTIQLSGKEKYSMPCSEAATKTWGSNFDKLNCPASC